MRLPRQRLPSAELFCRKRKKYRAAGVQGAALFLGAERLLNEELERLASSEAALAAAMRDRKVVSEEIIMTQTVVTDKTDEASVAAKKLADELRAAGGGARSAAAEVEELPKALEKTSDGLRHIQIVGCIRL